jgi:hypothetical protein
VSYSKKLPVGTACIAGVALAQDKWGEVFAYWVPYKTDKFSAGTYIVHALSDIRAHKTVIVVDQNNGALEQSESNPLQSPYPTLDDYAEIAFSATEQEYIIGTSAHGTNASVPVFAASQIALSPDQDCYVKFNSSKNVRHRMLLGQIYTYPLRVTAIYVTRVAVNGTLTIRAVGGNNNGVER